MVSSRSDNVTWSVSFGDPGHGAYIQTHVTMNFGSPPDLSVGGAGERCRESVLDRARLEGSQF